MSTSISLTTHLLSSSPSSLDRATKHPFLSQAATSSLPLPLLKSWLSQDRLYALSYLTFASALLSRTPIPAITSASDRTSTLEWRIADALIDCLTNIRTELALFESAAAEEGWSKEVCEGVKPVSVTRAYAELFAGAAAAGQPMLVGLTALWATEECYLRAWRFAAERVPEGKLKEGGDVMQRVFIPNWSSQEFEGFVRRLRALVDELAEREERDGWVWRKCEGIWGRILEVEERFWPKVEGLMLAGR